MSTSDFHPSLTITAVSGTADETSAIRVRQLRVVHAPRAGRWAMSTVGRSPVEIGRIGQTQSPLALDDKEVSRLHAVVEPDGAGGYRIVDRGSRNGTFVNGQKVQTAKVEHGAVVRVGKTLLLFLDHAVAHDVQSVAESPRLLGRSEVMRRLRADLAMVAPRNIPVLVLGETGVGKELVAEEIHRQSGRAGQFVPVNCAALPEALAESELFGHVAGAFTGAKAKSDGLFMAAQNGTLFLDEVGECPAPIQAKLLRALAKSEVRAVGAAEAVTVDVRIIAATNRDLSAEIAADSFRSDLFARLSGWVQRIPPLRERKEDILPLAAMFLARVAPSATISTNAAEALLLYHWPFNVRELEQVISAAGVRAASVNRVRCEHLPENISAVLGPRAQLKEPIANDSDSEPHPVMPQVPRDAVPARDDLMAVLAYFAGNIAQVAEYFGKDRKQVYRWAERYQIDLDQVRKP
ncbi:MAG: FHA domain-containing protein [Kofleriaceae bacterium]|nr:MAG: FHA domain-containing protein [Kofleriaceae bacterium]MBZ0236275.1 sigma 54-interacting transcriptional regulator [Kofleriaceae bacterium]